MKVSLLFLTDAYQGMMLPISQTEAFSHALINVGTGDGIQVLTFSFEENKV